MNLTNLWWSLPKWMTNLVKPNNPTSLTIHAYKWNGDWYFNAPHLLTWMESLVFTDVLDELAVGGNKCTLTISTTHVDGAISIWYEGDDAWDQTASIYVWGTKTIWLCGWLPWFFGYKPSTLWITVD